MNIPSLTINGTEQSLNDLGFESDVFDARQEDTDSDFMLLIDKTDFIQRATPKYQACQSALTSNRNIVRKLNQQEEIVLQYALRDLLQHPKRLGFIERHFAADLFGACLPEHNTAKKHISSVIFVNSDQHYISIYGTCR